MQDLVRIPRPGDRVQRIPLKRALAIAMAPPSREKLAQRRRVASEGRS